MCIATRIIIIHVAQWWHDMKLPNTLHTHDNTRLSPPHFRCCMQPYSVRVYSIGFPILFRMLSQDDSTRNIHTAIAIIKFIDVHNVMCLYFCYIIHAWSWRENPLLSISSFIDSSNVHVHTCVWCASSNGIC